MWPPPNILSHPSKEEIQKAKEEITIIELEIVEAELRLNALRKSLSERKAWIAPIRTAPPEILSLIFIEAGRANWKAPLVLQSVSRRWRDVVEGSPKAWKFIPLSKYSSERRSELILLFLERSGNTPLHIHVEDESLLGYMERLDDRIECIHLKTILRVLPDRYLQRGRAFHRLERLKIDQWDWDPYPPTDDLTAWDMSFFPNLKVLDIKSLSLSLFRAITAAPEFPAIRHLTIECIGPWKLPDILTKCAMSLESVDLFYDSGSFEALDMEPEIHFPRLRYLNLVDWSYEESRLRFKATTPNLQARLDGNQSTFHTVKVDTGSVVLLHALCTPDLSRYPRLVILCFSGESSEVIKATECLQGNPALCPDLALIEYRGEMPQEQLVKAKDALLARGRVTGQNIQLVEGTMETREERAHMFRRVQPCGDHMPCNN